MLFRWILLLAVFVAAMLGLLVGVLNPEPVTLDLAIWTPSLPLGAMLLLVFGTGILIGLLLFWLLFALPARLRRVQQPSTTRGSELRPPQ